MGRPKLYHTDEDRLAAGRERSCKNYERNRLEICEKRRTKYKESKAVLKVGKLAKPKHRSSPMTDEERKLKNKLKSARYRQRKKSEIARRRANGNSTVNSRISDDRTVRLFKEGWQRQIQYHVAQLPRTLNNVSVETFLENSVKECLCRGLSSGFSSATQPFDRLLERTLDFQSEVWNKLGAGVELDQVREAVMDIRKVIQGLQDLELRLLEGGRAGFIESYFDELLGNTSVEGFLEKQARLYLKDGDSSGFPAAAERFEGIHIHPFDDADCDEADRIAQVVSGIKKVIYHLHDLEEFAMDEGRAEFLASYLNGLLGYQN